MARAVLFRIVMGFLFLAEFGACGSAAVVIDNFQVGSITVARLGDTVAGAEQSGLEPASVLGGRRSIVVGEYGTSEQTLTIDAAAGQMSFVTGDTHGYFDIAYGSPANPLNLDLLADGANAFALTYDPTPEKPRIGVMVVSATGTSTIGTYSAGVYSETLADGSTRFVLPFDQFLADVDFQNVEQIVLSSSRFSPQSQVMLSELITVPEPATITCIGLLGVAAFRPRQRRALARWESAG